MTDNSLEKEILDFYNNLSLYEKEKIHKLFNNGSVDEDYKYLKNLVFKRDPPTPEEFLDPKEKWLPKSFTDSIYEWVKEDFLLMTSKQKNYSQIVLYGATRLGKSFCALLLMLYVIVYVHHLRDMSLYYNLAGGTNLSMYILSFNYNKVYQIYLAPLYNILESSERFVQVKFQDQVKPLQEKYGCDKIVYSKASIYGHITLASGLRLVSGNNDALSIIGNNILCGIISEISFFIENDGATEDGIFRLYSDLVERIQATVGNKYLAFTFLDTSANNYDSVIENYILKQLSKREDVLFRWRRRWDVKENVEKFCPIYKKTGKCFALFVGSVSTAPKILEDHEVSFYDSSLIEYVPIDFKSDFERNIIKSIKDICGRPSTNESRLFQDIVSIERIFDNDLLLNEVSSIECDSQDDPNDLILRRIDIDKYFVRGSYGSLYFKRAPNESRYIGIDLAYSVKNDLVGFSIGHKEWSRKSQRVMFVCDMAFAISPGHSGINLESVPRFIKYLKDSGIMIEVVVFDTFQSESMKQFFDREGIMSVKQSVDRNISHYMNLYNVILNSQLKSGKNIYLKNNLKSLYRVRYKGVGKEKIDHSDGDVIYIYDGNWDRSLCGMNMKDVSDAVCNWVSMASQDNKVPIHCYEDENDKFGNRVDFDLINNSDNILKKFSILIK